MLLLMQLLCSHTERHLRSWAPPSPLRQRFALTSLPLPPALQAAAATAADPLGSTIVGTYGYMAPEQVRYARSCTALQTTANVYASRLVDPLWPSLSALNCSLCTRAVPLWPSPSALNCSLARFVLLRSSVAQPPPPPICMGWAARYSSCCRAARPAPSLSTACALTSAQVRSGGKSSRGAVEKAAEKPLGGERQQMCWGNGHISDTVLPFHPGAISSTAGGAWQLRPALVDPPPPLVSGLACMQAHQRRFHLALPARPSTVSSQDGGAHGGGA